MLQENGLWIALGCAVLALVYGGWSIRWILAQPAATSACRKSPRRSRSAPRRT
jgi:K(+)-stimulated pyrophosphate-energized sodium pump